MTEQINSAEFDGEKWTLKTNNDDVAKVEFWVDPSVDGESKYIELVMYIKKGEKVGRRSTEYNKEVYKEVCDQFENLHLGNKLPIIGAEEQK